MQYTTHFNLNLPEGTDIVNPLVQDNPNYSAIDAAMFANKQAVIGTASEVVSGTVHAITRSNTDSDYFRFTATGNWTAGDSMSVDGTTVSVFLSDGTTPATGAYIINTEVLALLSGTRVTLIISAGVSASEIGTLSNLTTSDTSNLVNAINEVNSYIHGGESTQVIADGIKTNANLFNELFALVDNSKVSVKSSLVLITSAHTLVFDIATIDIAEYDFTRSASSTTYSIIQSIQLSTASRYFSINTSTTTTTATDKSNEVPAAGTIIKVVY